MNHTNNPCPRCGGTPMASHPSWAPYNSGLCFRCNGTGIDPQPEETMEKNRLHAITAEWWVAMGLNNLPEKAHQRGRLMLNAFLAAHRKGYAKGKQGAFTAFVALLKEHDIPDRMNMFNHLCTRVRSTGVPDASLHLSENADAHLGQQEKLF